MATAKTASTTLVLWRAGRVAGATVMTGLLLVFLVASRLFDTHRTPDQEIRLLEIMPEVALPAPPPPPPEEPETLPPPPKVELPRLEIQLENVAPPLKASLDPNIDLTMQTAMFELEVDPPPAPAPVPRPTPKPAPKPVVKPKPAPVVRTTYSAGELDSMPRLINRPRVSFPREMSSKGVNEGRVMLEITISTSGGVDVRRVLSSSDPAFSQMAKQFASRARFSTPKKNGQPVTAIYKWPLILRP